MAVFGKIGLYLIAIVVVGALAVIACIRLPYTSCLPPPETTAPVKTVFVMDFTPITSAELNRSFGDSLREDIEHKLTTFPDVEVISITRQSRPIYTFEELRHRFGDSHFSIRYLVNGTFRVDGEGIWVRAVLSSRSGGAVLWSDRYERPIREDVADTSDLFDVESEIAGNIVETVIEVMLKDRGWLPK